MALAMSASLFEAGSTVTNVPSPLATVIGPEPSVPSSRTSALTATRAVATLSTVKVTEPG